ncbi:unnamed protein product [Calypogeia fissa]
MAIAKRLILHVCAVSALLLLCVVAPASLYVCSSGTPLCVPRVSIRCHESDCGSFFQRCGSTELLQVPDHEVCYKGALLPASRTDLHSCPSTTLPHNSTRPTRDTRKSNSGKLGSCDCTTCTYPEDCQCVCTEAGLNVRAAVTCQNIDYPSLAAAMSMGVSPAQCSEVPRRPMWEITLETVQRHYNELFTGQWSLEDFAGSFTFQPPVITSDLKGTCSCYISATCATQCTGR